MILYGGSGHAKVVLDCLEASGINVKAVFDSNINLRTFAHVQVYHEYSAELFPENKLIISIGHNATRKKIAEQVKHAFGIIKHPSAIIAGDVVINEGTVVFHNTVIQPSTVIGKHCVINTAATVDHDCELGDFVHIAPGAHICGNVKIGEGTLIGVGASVIPNITVGKWCTIGAGAAVTKDVPDGWTVVGVPAKRISG